LGNEYYLPQFYFNGSIISNSTYYLELCRQVYEATAHYFPDRVSGLASYAGFTGTQSTNVQVQWNAGLFPGPRNGFDHLTVHIYTLSTTNFRNVANPPWSWYTLMLAWPESSVRVVRDRFVDQFPKIDSNLRLWMTEFNLNTPIVGSDKSNTPGDAFAIDIHLLFIIFITFYI
jgi:hypothetical protein